MTLGTTDGSLEGDPEGIDEGMTLGTTDGSLDGVVEGVDEG
jgi:hypothetical protein